MSSNPQNEKNKKYFSAKLNELLTSHNKKQVDLHNDLGIPKSTITGYIKGKSLPNKETAFKLANYFGVKISDLDNRFKPTYNQDDLNYALKHAHNFSGKPLSENDKKIIGAYLRGYFKIND